jgi:hypothetical protein
MTVALAIDTVAMLLLALLVAALLRSHAEVLRRLDSTTRATGAARPLSADLHIAPAGEGRAGAVADPIVGTTMAGAPARRDLTDGETGTLLAFLTSGCSTCQDFWRTLAADPRVPGAARVVAVVKDAQFESPVKLQRLASDRVDVVMSSAAWDDYEVPLSPYFVFVDSNTGLIHSEGAATRWEQVESLLADAIAETPLEPSRAVEHDQRLHDSHPERIRAADDALEAAGIGPGDPRLYFGEDPPAADRRTDA